MPSWGVMAEAMVVANVVVLLVLGLRRGRVLAVVMVMASVLGLLVLGLLRRRQAEAVVMLGAWARRPLSGARVAWRLK